MKFGTTTHGALAAFVCLLLVGCSALPSTGPTASDLEKQAVKLETVSPEMATVMWQDQLSREQRRVTDVVTELSHVPTSVNVRLFPGARLDIVLWTQPQWGSAAADISDRHDTISKTDFGIFTVGNDGAVTLPYVGAVSVAGKDVKEAQGELTRRYSATRQFQAPQVTLSVQGNAHQHVLVTGAASHPTVLDWREGGISLAEAITSAGGDVIYKAGEGELLTANQAVIIRKGIKYELPVKDALESSVQLLPNDEVLLEHESVVKVQCLGGGWGQNAVKSFDEIPTLTKVVASGGGLSTQAAQGASVFVLSANRSIIYRFQWDSLDGLQAAQHFPVQNGDIVYVATAPIVQIQQITNILFSAAYPVATAKAVR